MNNLLRETVTFQNWCITGPFSLQSHGAKTAMLRCKRCIGTRQTNTVYTVNEKEDDLYLLPPSSSSSSSKLIKTITIIIIIIIIVSKTPRKRSYENKGEVQFIQEWAMMGSLVSCLRRWKINKPLLKPIA